MPRNGSGTYTLPESPFVPNTVISSSDVNSDFSDIASALTDSVAADGQTPITGALQGVAGTAAAPGWTFHADTTSGMYLDESGVLGTGILGLVAADFGILINGEAYTVTAAAPSAAGSGYAVGDTIIIAGGTGILSTILTVATITGAGPTGGVATASVLVGGSYSNPPASPASQASTSGSGTGATFTLTDTVSGDPNSTQISDLNGAALWTQFGATTYMAGAMAEPNGLGLANYIGSANIAAAVKSSLPVPMPEGRLTPVSNTPVITGDSSAATVIYYTPWSGLWNPIHNGTTIIPYQLSGQLQLTLTSAQASNGIYDVFLAYNGGTPVIGTGPSWAAGTSGSVTPGSCARGTGSGGTALTRLNGVLVNAAAVSLTWNTGSGNNTLSVPANQGIYLGSIYVDATAGQVTCNLSYGQNRKYGVWNMYNRVPILLSVGDPTSFWQYGNPSGTTRASNGAPSTYSATVFNAGSGTAANGCVALCGIAEEAINVTFRQVVGYSATNVSTSNPGVNGWYIGMGVNSTTSFTGDSGYIIGQSAGWTATPTISTQVAPPLGLTNIAALESVLQGAVADYYGTSSFMRLVASLRA